MGAVVMMVCRILSIVGMTTVRIHMGRTAPLEMDGIATMIKMCQDTGYTTSIQLSSILDVIPIQLVSTTITILEHGTVIIRFIFETGTS